MNYFQYFLFQSSQTAAFNMDFVCYDIILCIFNGPRHNPNKSNHNAVLFVDWIIFFIDSNAFYQLVVTLPLWFEKHTLSSISCVFRSHLISATSVRFSHFPVIITFHFAWFPLFLALAPCLGSCLVPHLFTDYSADIITATTHNHHHRYKYHGLSSISQTTFTTVSCKLDRQRPAAWLLPVGCPVALLPPFRIVARILPAQPGFALHSKCQHIRIAQKDFFQTSHKSFFLINLTQNHSTCFFIWRLWACFWYSWRVRLLPLSYALNDVLAAICLAFIVRGRTLTPFRSHWIQVWNNCTCLLIKLQNFKWNCWTSIKICTLWTLRTIAFKHSTNMFSRDLPDLKWAFFYFIFVVFKLIYAFNYYNYEMILS